jgi:hypothetical protein
MRWIVEANAIKKLSEWESFLLNQYGRGGIRTPDTVVRSHVL